MKKIIIIYSLITEILFALLLIIRKLIDPTIKGFFILENLLGPYPWSWFSLLFNAMNMALIITFFILAYYINFFWHKQKNKEIEIEKLLDNFEMPLFYNKKIDFTNQIKNLYLIYLLPVSALFAFLLSPIVIALKHPVFSFIIFGPMLVLLIVSMVFVTIYLLAIIFLVISNILNLFDKVKRFKKSSMRIKLIRGDKIEK